MRFLPAILLLGAFALAAPPEEETKTPADPWSVEKPASRPEGDPMTLRIALEPGMAHKLDATITQDMKTNVGPSSMAMGMTVWLRVLRKNDKGQAEVEVPLQLTKMTQNGADQLAMAKTVMNDPKLFATIDDRGEIVPGTFRAEGLGPFAGQMESQIANLFGYLPPDAVRVGESWEVPVEALAKQISIKGGKLEGTAYQVLEAVEERDGARCARVKTLLTFTLTGDNLQMPGGLPPAKGTIRAKGQGQSWHGLDGYVRASRVEMQVRMELNTMGMDLTFEGPATVSIAGGPEPFFRTTEGEE